MREERKHVKTQEKDNIRISITYGQTPLIDCMKKIITKRVLHNHK